MPNAQKMKSYVDRARSSVGLVRYKLGRGGFNAKYPYRVEWDQALCDCSGFASFVYQLSRKPKLTRWWWIETTNIYRDAMDKQKVFVRIKEPIPGCLVVYPDREGHEGHVGIVTQAYPLRVVDCTPAHGIAERLGSVFEKNHAIYCILKQDS